MLCKEQFEPCILDQLLQFMASTLNRGSPQRDQLWRRRWWSHSIAPSCSKACVRKSLRYLLSRFAGRENVGLKPQIISYLHLKGNLSPLLSTGGLLPDWPSTFYQFEIASVGWPRRSETASATENNVRFVGSVDVVRLAPSRLVPALHLLLPVFFDGCILFCSS